MLERDADQQLNGRIELDDAYLGGQRRGGKRGRGAAGKTPFVAAVETTPEGKPVRLKLRRVTGFCNHAISGFAKRSLDPTCEVVSDGLACFAAVTDAGCRHQVIKTGSGPAAARTPARGEVPAPFALRLFLPEEWTRDAARLERAGVPGDRRTPRTKPEIALAEIGRAVAAGMRFGPVLADAGYGISATFRAGLSERGLHWAVGIPRILKVYPADVALLPPPPGRRRKLSEPDQISRPAEAVLAGVPWRGVTWRRGTKGRLSAHFAATRIRVADDPAQGIGAGDRRRGSAQGIGAGDRRQARAAPPRRGGVGRRRAPGVRRDEVLPLQSSFLCNLPLQSSFLCNLPADTGLNTLAATIKARWACEQARQQLKEELGPDHFEGRSWTGLHRHALMTMLAYAFLQHRRLAAARRGEKARRSTAATEPARHPRRRHRPAPARTINTHSRGI